MYKKHCAPSPILNRRTQSYWPSRTPRALPAPIQSKPRASRLGSPPSAHQLTPSQGSPAQRSRAHTLPSPRHPHSGNTAQTPLTGPVRAPATSPRTGHWRASPHLHSAQVRAPHPERLSPQTPARLRRRYSFVPGKNPVAPQRPGNLSAHHPATFIAAPQEPTRNPPVPDPPQHNPEALWPGLLPQLRTTRAQACASNLPLTHQDNLLPFSPRARRTPACGTLQPARSPTGSSSSPERTPSPGSYQSMWGTGARGSPK